ncbi:hypothetical protein C8J56DRAFT_904433 [Mycena floridula]|nr:hypothetical protein C8J56DRAFT_904433 [Mycena floridula]
MTGLSINASPLCIDDEKTEQRKALASSCSDIRNSHGRKRRNPQTFIDHDYLVGGSDKLVGTAIGSLIKAIRAPLADETGPEANSRRTRLVYLPVQNEGIPRIHKGFASSMEGYEAPCYHIGWSAVNAWISEEISEKAISKLGRNKKGRTHWEQWYRGTKANQRSEACELHIQSEELFWISSLLCFRRKTLPDALQTRLGSGASMTPAILSSMQSIAVQIQPSPQMGFSMLKFNYTGHKMGFSIAFDRTVETTLQFYPPQFKPNRRLE